MSKGQERSILFAITLFVGGLIGSGVTQIALNVDWEYDANKTPVGLIDTQEQHEDKIWNLQQFNTTEILEQCVNEYNKLNQECK